MLNKQIASELGVALLASVSMFGGT